jgi:hypothetical protein
LGPVTANAAARSGKPFARGHLYRLLSNPIHVGQIAHKGQLFPGQHPALIDDETLTAGRGGSPPTPATIDTSAPEVQIQLLPAKSQQTIRSAVRGEGGRGL